LPATRYLFFGGKGGVGKTTAAAATALLLLEQAKAGERILLLSTDPAHSIADSLGVSLGCSICEVASCNGAALDAWEMDAAAALQAFKEKHHDVLRTIADRGTLLDEADINDLLNLSLPGLDEVMALVELSDFDRRPDYSRIVVDTAPSGHTTRLLQLPKVFERWIHALDRMSDKHRFMRAQLSRRARVQPDAADAFLSDLTERVTRIREILTSPAKSAFVMVTIPESMAVEETIRYVRDARAEGAPITDLIVNRVEAPHSSCAYCRTRHDAQQPHLARLKGEFKDLRQHSVRLFADEVNGMEALRSVGSLLWGKRRGVSVGAVSDRGLFIHDGQRPSAGKSTRSETAATVDSPTKRLLIVGGKGGVGKTTTAAGLALRLAEEHPTQRFLVFSTDPAHSLSDSFAEVIGPFRQGIAGVSNLDGVEINAVEMFEEFKNRYRTWIEEIFDSLTAGSNWNVEFDREAMQELIALAPPGIDEIAALSAVSDFLDDRTYTAIVLDTAPTGHLLRFLELPHLALDWVRALMKLLLKYRQIVTSSNAAEELVRFSKRIKRVIGVFKDQDACDFTAVAIPERMSLEETTDLVRGVENSGISVGRILINNVLPAAAQNCEFCAERRGHQLKNIDRVRAQFAGRAPLLVTEQLPEPVTGPASLRRFMSGWPQAVREARGSA